MRDRIILTAIVHKKNPATVLVSQVDKLIKLSSGDTKMSSEKEKALNIATS